MFEAEEACLKEVFGSDYQPFKVPLKPPPRRRTLKLSSILCADCGRVVKRSYSAQKRCRQCLEKCRALAKAASNKRERDKNAERLAIPGNREKERAHNKTSRREGQERIVQKHARLRKLMREEGVPKTDLLWSVHFYEELIQNTRCHYCWGFLNRTGHGLDRMDNSLGHLCYNVVPCCKRCNKIKSNHLTYAEMMIVAPALQEITLRKNSPGGVPLLVRLAFYGEELQEKFAPQLCIQEFYKDFQKLAVAS